MLTSHLLILTRTPLHVGSGASVGAIDQPIQRERHTGFPIIPASSLKGSFADHWNEGLKRDDKGNTTRGDSTAAWLFGSDDANHAAAGALLFSEARLLAFPIRSAKGGYAWITSPLLLRRAQRDEVLPETPLPTLQDGQALFQAKGLINIGDKLVLEEYTFTQAGTDADRGNLYKLAEALANKFAGDAVWKELPERLVLISDGQMSFFSTAACEIAQHVRINDSTGTADDGGLFNQENVPADTLFYSLLRATDSRLSKLGGPRAQAKASEAIDVFRKKLDEAKVFQFGGDASTGLGFCTVIAV